MWTVLLTPEYEAWFATLTTGEQDSLLVSLGVLRELRTQHRGQPLRSLFAFDAKRQAIVLVGGNKRGDKRFYKRMIPVADAIFERYLLENEEAQ